MFVESGIVALRSRRKLLEALGHFVDENAPAVTGTTAAAVAPKDAEAYLGRGVAYAWKKDDDKAIADYNEALRLDPQNADGYIDRGCAFYRKRQDDKALADFDKAIALNPERAAAYFRRSDVRTRLAQYDNAMADLNKAIQLAPGKAESYISRAQAHRRKKNYDRAIADSTKAIELDPKHAEAVVGRGNAYRQKGWYARALSEYDTALKIDPKCSYAYSSFAWLLATCPVDKHRDGKKALEFFNKARGRNAETDLDLEVLAAVYAEIGKFDDAVRWQKKALEAPDIPAEELDEMRKRLSGYEQRMPYREQPFVEKKGR
jgi:tetratricopeptide (TPR) repeat protein